MKRALEQIALSIETEAAQIGKLYVENVGPLIKEFERLMRLLKRHTRNDTELQRWIERERLACDATFEKVAIAMEKAKKAKAKIPIARTYEEWLADMEHAEVLGRLARQKVEEQISYLEKSTRRLAEKVASMESPPPTK